VREADNLPPYNSEVKSAWICNSTPHADVWSSRASNRTVI